jgi:hypothetical protein
MAELVTIAELADRLRSAGRPISISTLRYQCQRGSLSVDAHKIGKTWAIPTDAADRFAELWRPWGPATRRPKPEAGPARKASHRRAGPA